MKMKLHLSTKLQLKQEQRLAPQMIQAIEILQLPMASLLDYVENELAENDALEVDEPEDELEAVADPVDGEDPGPTAAEIDEYSPDDWDEWRPPRPARVEERDRKLDALMNSPGRAASLQDLLSDQLGMLDLPERLADLARILIYNLDDRGYLAVHRFVEPLLSATDANGYLDRPLGDVVASVDGVGAVKVPKAGRNVTAEQVAEAEDARDRHVLEAQRVLGVIQDIRARPGGARLSSIDLMLAYPLEDIIRREAGEYTLLEAEEALGIVQRLEPRGVAGRTLGETLILQLDPADLLFVEKKRLIAEHLEDLEKNRLQKIARAMDLEVADIQMLIEELKGLEARPAGGLAPESAQAVYPDLFVEQLEDGSFQIDLVNSQLPPLSVSLAAIEVAGDTSAEDAVRNLYRKRVDDARWLIEAIQQRQQTLTRVAQRIFFHQQAYLQHGDDGLRPLKMQTVADELGIHVSTVSRAIADKYVQTPRGVKALKFFFTGGTETADGGVESRHKVKTLVADIIAAEDPIKPLSDDDVAAKLKARGLSIARRTVTKYRKQLGILSSRQRRQWT